MSACARSIQLAALLALLPISVAQAGDGVPSPYAWTGFYIGGHAGFGSANTRWTNENINPYSSLCPFCAMSVPGEKFSADSAVAGGQIGYNYQLRSWVLGPEVAFSGTALEDNHPISIGAFNSPAVTTLESKTKNILTVTGRLGYSFDHSFLVYGKGGYASADLDAEGTDKSFFNYSFRTDKRTDGWTAGGGVEYRLSNNITFAIEYAHLGFSDQTLVGNIAVLPTFPDKIKISSDADTVTARLNLFPFK